LAAAEGERQGERSADFTFELLLAAKTSTWLLRRACRVAPHQSESSLSVAIKLYSRAVDLLQLLLAAQLALLDLDTFALCERPLIHNSLSLLGFPIW
jgi:hypothetical protein